MKRNAINWTRVTEETNNSKKATTPESNIARVNRLYKLGLSPRQVTRDEAIERGRKRA